MREYLFRRMIDLIPTLVGVSIVVFLAMRMVPGDPARLVAGPEASEEVVATIRHNLGLDRPLTEQYWQFISGAIRLDFGRSVRSDQSVSEILASRLPATIELALSSILFAIIVGVLTGIWSGVKPDSLFDTTSMLMALFGISMPSFWLGLMMIWLFAVKLGWFPVGGGGSFASLVMPAITIGAQSTAMIARMMRSSVMEVLRQDYIRTAKAKGLPPIRVITKHAVRNALIPTITVVGLQFGYLLAGSVVTETVFNWPGMGLLLVNAVATRDYPVVQGAVLLFAVVFMITNLLVDIAYGLVDPRIKYE